MYDSLPIVSTAITASEARQTFADLVNRAAYGNERIIVARHGRDVVAIVPISDLRTLQALEADPNQAAVVEAPMAGPASTAKRNRAIRPR